MGALSQARDFIVVVYDDYIAGEDNLDPLVLKKKKLSQATGYLESRFGDAYEDRTKRSLTSLAEEGCQWSTLWKVMQNPKDDNAALYSAFFAGKAIRTE